MAQEKGFNLVLLTIVMSMNKTKPTEKDANEFLKHVENDRRREDSMRILAIMKEITNESPVVWGSSIVGFGSYHYKYKSGREGDWPMLAFSPRKRSLSIYIMDGFEKYERLLKSLGKHKIGVSCLYINKLADVDMDVLKEIMTKSYQYMKSNYA